MVKQQAAIARCGDRKASSTSSMGRDPCNQASQKDPDKMDTVFILYKRTKHEELWGFPFGPGRKSSLPIKTRMVGISDAIFVPLLKLALKASSRLS